MNEMVEMILARRVTKVLAIDIGVPFNIIFDHRIIWFFLHKPSRSLFKLNHGKSLQILASTFFHINSLILPENE